MNSDAKTVRFPLVAGPQDCRGTGESAGVGRAAVVAAGLVESDLGPHQRPAPLGTDMSRAGRGARPRQVPGGDLDRLPSPVLGGQDRGARLVERGGRGDGGPLNTEAGRAVIAQER